MTTRRQQAARDSWRNPVLRAARLTRLAVAVNGRTYPSLGAALRDLGLPDKLLKDMRKELKAEGTIVFSGVRFDARPYTTHHGAKETTNDAPNDGPGPVA